MTSYSGKVTGTGGGGFSSEIRVEGLEATIAALRSLEPDVLKTMQREIRAALTKVRGAAAGSPPAPALGQYAIRSSARGKRVGMRLAAVDKYSAVFEFAGTRNMDAAGTGPITPQGAAMVRWLDGFGRPGRFLWGAWDANRAGFEADMKAAIERAEAALQASLGRAGEVF